MDRTLIRLDGGEDTVDEELEKFFKYNVVGVLEISKSDEREEDSE